MSDLTLMPIERVVVIDMEKISAVQELPLEIYSILVDGQWVTFTPEESTAVKAKVEGYFGEWGNGE